VRKTKEWSNTLAMITINKMIEFYPDIDFLLQGLRTGLIEQRK